MQLKIEHLVIGVVILGLLGIGPVADWLGGKKPTQPPAQPPAVIYPPSGCLIEDATYQGGAINAITGAAIADAQGYTFTNDNLPWDSDVNINSAAVSFGTDYPSTFSGYMIIGNDAETANDLGTDRGTERYFRKIPISWDCAGSFSKTNVPLYSEATSVTISGYDDGILETTLNVSVGSGATVDSTELKLAVGSVDTAIGNTDFNRPIAACFNTTGAAQSSDYDEVRPLNYEQKISVPEFLSGKAVIGSYCYVLQTKALADVQDYDTEYRFGIRIKAKSGVNPTPGNHDIYAMFLDYTYGVDDKLNFVPGWASDSVDGTDRDIGIETVSLLTKLIAVS
jgi:hypothetical protein